MFESPSVAQASLHARLAIYRAAAPTSFAELSATEPGCNVAHVGLCGSECRRLAQNGITRGLIHETGASRTGIPVVVHKMMEAALGDRSPLTRSGFEGHGEVESPARDLAVTGGDDPCVFAFRHPDSSLVRVTRQESDSPGGGRLINQHRVDLAHHLHFLEIAICPGMEIRPNEEKQVRIIALESKAGVQVLRVELMSQPDPIQRTHKTTQDQKNPCDQQAAAIAAKGRNRLALRRRQTASRVNSELPHLVENAPVQRRKNGIVSARRPVAGNHLEKMFTT